MQLPTLKRGERYAGIVLTEAGKPSHHLILLAGEKPAIQWQDAMTWAKEKGGELPTRQEQSLLFANCKKHFKPTRYWSSKEYTGNAGWAWFQYFDGGHQYHDHMSYELRARAVRRLVIE